jgi:hypothetical protein
MGRRIPDPSAIDFFNFAREYQNAANRLLDLDLEDSTNPYRAGAPIYFLYCHAVELALKAFLRSFNRPIPRGQAGHWLKELYKECRDLGLAISPEDRFASTLGPLAGELGNIVTLLVAGNEDNAFRYGKPVRAELRASLPWTRDVVEQLVLAVGAHLAHSPKQDAIAAGPAHIPKVQLSAVNVAVEQVIPETHVSSKPTDTHTMQVFSDGHGAAHTTIVFGKPAPGLIREISPSYHVDDDGTEHVGELKTFINTTAQDQKT